MPTRTPAKGELRKGRTPAKGELRKGRTPAKGAPRKARITTIRVGSVVVSRLFASYALSLQTSAPAPAWLGVGADVWRDAVKALRAKGVPYGHTPALTPDGTPRVCPRTLAHWRRSAKALALHYRRRVQWVRRERVVVSTPEALDQALARRRRGAPRRSPHVVPSQGCDGTKAPIARTYTPTGRVVWVVRSPAPAEPPAPAAERLTKAQRAEFARLARLETKAQRRALRATAAPAPIPAPAPQHVRMRQRTQRLAGALKVLSDLWDLEPTHPHLAGRVQGIVARLACAAVGSSDDHLIAYCMRDLSGVSSNPRTIAQLLNDLPIVS